MKRIIFLALLCLPAILRAQVGSISGTAILGGTKAQTSGLPSSNYLQGVVPSATVTVYLHGTETLAIIYSDENKDPLSNPFTANTATSSNPGGWIFWAAVNQGYDVVLSGGIPPNTYPSPVTLVDLYAGTSGGGTPGTPTYSLQFRSPSGTFAGAQGITTTNGNDLKAVTLSSSVNSTINVKSLPTFLNSASAVGDGVELYTSSGWTLTNGSPTLTCTGCSFPSSITGKLLRVGLRNSSRVWTSSNDCVLTNGSTTVTCANSDFESTDAGLGIRIHDWNTNTYLTTTVAAYSSGTSVTLDTAWSGTSSTTTDTLSFEIFEEVDTTATYVNSTTLTMGENWPFPSLSSGSLVIEYGTDDYSALEAALTPSAQGDSQIFFPAGLYLTSKCLSLPSVNYESLIGANTAAGVNQSLEPSGANGTGTVILQYAGSSPCVETYGSATYDIAFYAPAVQSIENLSFRGNAFVDEDLFVGCGTCSIKNVWAQESADFAEMIKNSVGLTEINFTAQPAANPELISPSPNGIYNSGTSDPDGPNALISPVINDLSGIGIYNGLGELNILSGQVSSNGTQLQNGNLSTLLVGGTYDADAHIQDYGSLYETPVATALKGINSGILNYGTAEFNSSDTTVCHMMPGSMTININGSPCGSSGNTTNLPGAFVLEGSSGSTPPASYMAYGVPQFNWVGPVYTETDVLGNSLYKDLGNEYICSSPNWNSSFQLQGSSCHMESNAISGQNNYSEGEASFYLTQPCTTFGTSACSQLVTLFNHPLNVAGENWRLQLCGAWTGAAGTMYTDQPLCQEVSSTSPSLTIDGSNVTFAQAANTNSNTLTGTFVVYSTTASSSDPIQFTGSYKFWPSVGATQQSESVKGGITVNWIPTSGPGITITGTSSDSGLSTSPYMQFQDPSSASNHYLTAIDEYEGEGRLWSESTGSFVNSANWTGNSFGINVPLTVNSTLSTSGGATVGGTLTVDSNATVDGTLTIGSTIGHIDFPGSNTSISGNDSGMTLETGGTTVLQLFPSGFPTTNSAYASVDQSLTLNNFLKFTGSTTVANLPACSSALGNTMTIVSDASSPTYLGTLTGGGSTSTPVMCNGTSWVSF